MNVRRASAFALTVYEKPYITGSEGLSYTGHTLVRATGFTNFSPPV
jgi:hypothetical protein